MKVTYRLIGTSQPMTIEGAVNTYQKGDFYCILSVMDGKKVVRKIPIRTIFDILEDY